MCVSLPITKTSNNEVKSEVVSGFLLSLNEEAMSKEGAYTV